MLRQVGGLHVPAGPGREGAGREGAGCWQWGGREEHPIRRLSPAPEGKGGGDILPGGGTAVTHVLLIYQTSGNKCVPKAIATPPTLPRV